MAEFNYRPDLSDMKIIKTDVEQHNKFFYKGHPEFLIPEFSNESDDIWIIYGDYLKRVKESEIYDEDGGEITYHKVINKSTGLTECIYTAYGINFQKDGYMMDYKVKMEGYVVEKNEKTYFVTTYVDDGLN